MDQIVNENKQFQVKALTFDSNLKEASFWVEFRELTVRYWKALIRDDWRIKIQIVQMVFIGLLSLAVFWKSPSTTYAELMTFSGILFYCCCVQLFVSLLGVILSFIEE